MKKRYLFWDNYKGILIFLVVFGHFLYTYALKKPNSFANTLFYFIYLFHMPAFIFCSGYLSKSERSRGKEALTQLFLYYVIFNTGMMVFSKFDHGTNISLLTPYNSYWYLLSLIVWRFVIDDLSKVKGIVPISFIVTLLLGYNSEFSNLLSIRRTFAFFIFFLLGYLLNREKFEKFIDNRNYKTIFIGVLLSIISMFSIFVILDKIDINLSMVLMGAYKQPLDVFIRLFILVVSFIIIALMILVLPNVKIPFLTSFGKNSLLIYLIHRFLIYPFNDLFPYTGYPRMYIVYAFVASIAVCIVFSNEKLNNFVAKKVALFAKSITNEKNKLGDLLKTGLLLLLVALLSIKSPILDSIKTIITPKSPETNETIEEDGNDELTFKPFNEIDNSIKITYVGDLILLKDQVITAYDEEKGKYDFSSIF